MLREARSPGNLASNVQEFIQPEYQSEDDQAWKPVDGSGQDSLPE